MPETLNHTLTETRNLNWSSKNLVGVVSVAKCWGQTFVGSCALSEYFPSSLYFFF